MPQAADPVAAEFASHRSRLTGIAYRILGSFADAEDVVQEAWLRWKDVDAATIRDVNAFLARVTTRLALDRLRRVRARREEYVGSWLPEPVLTEPDVAERLERTEAISLALLVVLETLSPLERAVFVLREAFGYTHTEIAKILGRSETSIRQLAVRAHNHVRERRPRFGSDPTAQQQVTERFISACTGGDVAGLLDILAPGVTLVADGGGKARAPRLPVHGADNVVRFLLSTLRPEAIAAFLESIGSAQATDIRVAQRKINGDSGIVVFAGEQPITALALDVSDGRVQTIYLIANPDKLGHVTAE